MLNFGQVSKFSFEVSKFSFQSQAAPASAAEGTPPPPPEPASSARATTGPPARPEQTVSPLPALEIGISLECEHQIYRNYNMRTTYNIERKYTKLIVRPRRRASRWRPSAPSPSRPEEKHVRRRQLGLQGEAYGTATQIRDTAGRDIRILEQYEKTFNITSSLQHW